MSASACFSRSFQFAGTLISASVRRWGRCPPESNTCARIALPAITSMMFFGSIVIGQGCP